MGTTCSKSVDRQTLDGSDALAAAESGGIPDPEIYEFLQRSVQLTQQQQPSSSSSSAAVALPTKSCAAGQFHLLYKQQQLQQSGTVRQHQQQQQQQQATVLQQKIIQQQHSLTTATTTATTMTAPPHNSKEYSQPQNQVYPYYYPTRLLVRRHAVRPTEEGVSGTHIYAVRWTAPECDGSQQHAQQPDTVDREAPRQEQYCSSRPTTTTAAAVVAVNSNKGIMQKQQQPRSQYGVVATDSNAVVVGVAAPAAAAATASDQGTIGTTTAATITNNNHNSSGSSSRLRLEDRRTTAPKAAVMLLTSDSNNTTTVPTTTTVAADCIVLDHHDTKNNIDLQQQPLMSIDHLFQASAMSAPPKRKVADWVTVSAEHKIYVADVGLSVAECNHIVAVTEQQCRGQYAAYTYAKQTLGCREFPALALTVQDAVHTVVAAMLERCDNSNSHNQLLALDDREPHMVKYDVTKKERQKLDMHTDKSEWTFLIAVSNGAGTDYTGGGTYFECLDATVHVQRGHALIFPGKLRHCGQRITSGLRFLLVGFLVDKTPVVSKKSNVTAATAAAGAAETDEDLQQQQLYVNNIP